VWSEVRVSSGGLAERRMMASASPELGTPSSRWSRETCAFAFANR
jgi:hypothetical protein